MHAFLPFGSARPALSAALLLAAPLPLMAAQIGGKVFLDGNRNALLNTGEPGMNTITVRLTWAGPDGNFNTAGDNQTFTQVTDVNGNYNFTGLSAGNFRADLDDATLPVGLAVVAGVDPITFNGVTAAQVITTAHYALVSNGLNLTLWTVNEADPGNVLPRSGAGSPRLFCFTDYADQSGAHQFLDYGRLVWRDTNGVIQTFAGGDETNAESLAIDTSTGDAYIVINPAIGGFTVPVLFKVNLFSLRPNAAQVELVRIGEVRDSANVAASDIEGIAFDEPANLIYAVNTEGTQATDPERLLQINPLTAEWASRGFVQGTVSGTNYALTYTDGLEVVPTINPAGKVTSGVFYGYDQQDNHLYRINPANAAITALVNTVTDITTDIETIAWDEQNLRMVSVDNGKFELATIPLDGSAPVVMSTYAQQGLANSAATNDLEGAGFFLRSAYPLAAIGNHVWKDTNGNGQWDTGELPVSGAAVHLFFDSNDDGDFLDAGEDLPYLTTTTDAAGFYEFSGLQAGTFRTGLPASNFTIGQPLAAFPISSQITDTADNREDTDDNGIQSGPGQPVFSPAIDLSEGEIDRTVDFGMIAYGSLSGTVWSDADNDDDGDTGLTGITLTLVDSAGNPIDGDNINPGVQPITTLTGTGGTYSFTNVIPGTYGVLESQPPAYLSVSDRDGGNPNEIRPVTVLPGTDNPGNDFIEELPVGIGSMIFADTNANGYLDDETGVPFPVLVQLLFDANNDGDLDDPGESTPVQTTMTVGGSYNFTGRPPGHYQIVIPAPPLGYTLSSPNTDTADNGEDNDDNGTQSAAGAATYGPIITLLAGSEPDSPVDGTDADNDSTQDFGFTPVKPNNWTAWQNLNPLGGQNNFSDNPDGDLNDNLVEFAFCYDPKNGVPKNPSGGRGFCLVQNATGGFDIEVIRPTGYTGLLYSLQYTGALSPTTAWFTNDDDADIVPTIVSIGGGFQKVTWHSVDTLPILTGGQGFFRIMIQEVNLDLTAYTEVQGWYDHTIASQCETCSNPFLKKELFSGTADSDSSEDTLDITGSATGINIATLLAGRTGLFVEITSGPYEGHRFAVNAAECTADSIALSSGDPLTTLSPIPDLSDAPFALRETWRFADLFPASLFLSGGDLNNADNILTFSSATQSWTTYFLANLDGFGTYWVDSADLTGPPANQNTHLLDPCQGFYFHRRGPQITVPFYGIVRENSFRCPLIQGYNLTGGGYPIDQSYSSRAMTLEDGFLGDSDIRQADQVLFWKGDTTPGQGGYTNHYLLDAGNPYQRWVNVEDNFVTTLDFDPVFTATRAAFLCRTADLPGYASRIPWRANPPQP